MNSWIVVSIAALLGATTILYIAHLGADSHAGECEVCDLAAHGSAIEPGDATGEAESVLVGLVPIPDIHDVPATPHSTAGPRAPPIS